MFSVHELAMDSHQSDANNNIYIYIYIYISLLFVLEQGKGDETTQTVGYQSNGEEGGIQLPLL